MDERISARQHRKCVLVRLLPGGAVDQDVGTHIGDKATRPWRCRLGDDHRHRDAKLAPGIGGGDSGIAPGRADEAFNPAARIVLARKADAAELERSRRLERFKLQPDLAAARAGESQ